MKQETVKRKMSRSRWSFVACSLAVLLLAGGQWCLLQYIAWGRMIVVYSQHEPLLTALKKTFDGRHPCSLCLQVRVGQQEEQQKGQRLPLEKPDKTPELFCDARLVTAPPPPLDVFNAPAWPTDSCSDYTESPPSPPPRRAAGVL
ncbi:MAG: hypothetical protein HZA90_27535 [Verrucomicrobia bacterium]|nr:hypothetical protein [Verrucomicrobiota bacterium]